MWQALSWKAAENLRADAQIQGQVAADFPIILREDAVVVGAILMVVHATPTEAELRRAQKKILEIRIGRPWCW